ncbi:4-azaleucine resistance probable transporter AzlC [Marininema mesophilum]|uniref:4-azaleucine resistance probable transporter AzlC n=1 Tax=Marininema mesophilum TaxID=1048340 RepID=A0A1H3C619_9BACL|nr:AzlC family ABC transporter permease [Marininema mesophilum]SDX49607.1 4-azaleucine resistance probable transporter AzlC [Marininema mesophilum]
MELKKHSFKTGVLAAIPIAVGYIPVAVTFGVIAQQSGVALIHSVLMSGLVFAGASQFMAINMIIAGTGALEIILASFILNFRMFVMSISLQDKFRSVPIFHRVMLSSGITDETFAVASLREEKSDPFFYSGLFLTAYLSWVTGTILGGVMSNAIPATISESMSISLYAMFIGLLIPAVRRSWKLCLVALFGMGLNTIFSSFFSSGWAIVLATLGGGLLGIPFTRRTS